MVEWTDDGQRCQPQLAQRLAFFDATRDWLQLHGRRLQIIEGDWAERRRLAFTAVEQLLQI